MREIIKARVDPEKCFGCGVCVLKCEPLALKMKTVRPPEHIPEAVAVVSTFQPKDQQKRGGRTENRKRVIFDKFVKSRRTPRYVIPDSVPTSSP